MRLNPDKPTWNLPLLILCYALAAVLLLSWKMEPYASFWASLDRHAFYLLNGWVEQNRAAQIFWAAVNNRAFDGVAAAPMLILWYCFMRADNDRELYPRFISGLFFAIYVVAVMQIFRAIFPDPRLSPSLVLDGAHRLSELVPALSPKDESGSSFPGDHASVLLMVTAFLHHYAGRKYSLPALCITLLAVMPRLVGGAHWLTDVVVGALFITLTSVSLAVFTPLAHTAQNALAKAVAWKGGEERITRFFRKLPPRRS